MQERGPGPALTPAATRRWAPVAVTAAAVVAADQATKWWALHALDDRHIDLVWTLRFNLVFNSGAAFGLGSRFTPLVALAAMTVVVVLLRSSRTFEGLWPRLATGLVLGGAVGNLLDRLFRSGSGVLGGPVVDFIDLQWWPVFNVADIGVSVGAVLLALTVGVAEREPA